MLYGIYSYAKSFEQVSFLDADTLENAKEKAKKAGYDLEYYAVEELEDE